MARDYRPSVKDPRATVLTVEDDDAIRALIGGVLSSEFNMQAAGDAETALADGCCRDDALAGAFDVDCRAVRQRDHDDGAEAGAAFRIAVRRQPQSGSRTIRFG